MLPESELQVSASKPVSNKTWLKALITAGLILLMLIPITFVSNLVEERQSRQAEVKHEVSSKWAEEQTISFPYLFIPYQVIGKSDDGKTVVNHLHFTALPEDLDVTGNVSTEERQRSIYRVLLYRSELLAKGTFIIHLPDDVTPSSVDWRNIRLCLGISDFKGIEEKVTANVNSISHELTPGLPSNDIDETGLSAPLTLTAEDLDKQVSFELPLKIKGSDQLHFVPLAGNSQFTLRSAWTSPSFDGNTLPAERTLRDSGFEAVWNFNKANLPFNTTFKELNLKKADYEFGVSLLQPTDQYAKTMRCVKYAILFIGLTFSLFFIVEIMQKKPFHPVQYLLVGIALVVFYTLLLSISEFLLFDLAYLIASAATVLLIALYAKSHFKSWKVAGAFGSVTGFIYAFIFVLIRLEDTALLVGSIGLFIILALGMYASRKVNWYGDALTETVSI
jgi:inner membrane protein